MPFKWAALVGPGDVGIQVHRPRIHLSAAIPDGGKMSGRHPQCGLAPLISVVVIHAR